MSDEKQPRKNVWTPDKLAESPEKRRVHVEQRRAQIAPLVNDLKRLLDEVEADIYEREALPGDLPFQASLRARHTLKPFVEAVEGVDNLIALLTAFNARYTRAYEALPEKRYKRAEEKQRLKELKAGSAEQIEAAPEQKAEPSADGAQFFAHLNRRTG